MSRTDRANLAGGVRRAPRRSGRQPARTRSATGRQSGQERRLSLLETPVLPAEERQGGEVSVLGAFGPEPFDRAGPATLRRSRRQQRGGDPLGLAVPEVEEVGGGGSWTLPGKNPTPRRARLDRVERAKERAPRKAGPPTGGLGGSAPWSRRRRVVLWGVGALGALGVLFLVVGALGTPWEAGQPLSLASPAAKALAAESEARSLQASLKADLASAEANPGSLPTVERAQTALGALSASISKWAPPAPLSSLVPLLAAEDSAARSYLGLVADADRSGGVAYVRITQARSDLGAAEAAVRSAFLGLGVGQ